MFELLWRLASFLLILAGIILLGVIVLKALIMVGKEDLLKFGLWFFFLGVAMALIGAFVFKERKS